VNVSLTIAGFDTSSGAGASADLMVFAAHGLYGTACLTALTVQSTVGVERWEAVPADLVRDSLDCLARDLPPKGIKIGMLATGENVQVVVAFLRELPGREGIPVVLDPVLRSSSGHALLDEAGVRGLDELLKLVSWVTPNIDEVASITAHKVSGLEGISAAAEVLGRRYPGLNIVVTGGDMTAPDDFLLTAEGKQRWFRGEKVESTSTHGTGCAFSSALLSRLVLGDGPEEAVAAAKAYVTEGIRLAPVGVGSGHGPLDHLWPLKRR
jgi:hydroxymethylpyrimidine/phosphomethylpyrimidine kinase